MLDKFFKTSWKTTCLGMAYFLWEVFHEVCASLDGQPISKRNIGKACFVAVMGLVARDWNKSSEDEGLKPDSLDETKVKAMMNSFVFGNPPDSNRSGPTGGNVAKLIPLILATSLLCSGCHALNVAPIDIKPEAVDVKPNAVHVEMLPNAVTMSTNGKLETGAVQISGKVETDAIHAVVSPGAAVMQQGAITATATVQPNAFTTPLAKWESPIEITTAPKTVNIELHIEPGAVVVHAEGITDAATKPMQEIKAAVMQAGGKAETYLWYGFIGAALTIIILVIERVFMHYRHAAQLKQKEDAT